MAEARAAKVQQERRRKRGDTVVTGLKLHVDKEAKDPDYVYRWVNDTPGRVQQFYNNDWDKVEMDGNTDGAGSIPTKHVGTDSGRPIEAVLMRKRKDWFEADQKEKRQALDAVDDAIRRGVQHEKNEPELTGGVAYTPGGSNTINR